MWLSFHVTVHSAAESGGELRARPLKVTFDEARAQLSELPRMFIEPDGSFVWRGDDAGQTWQVDGNLVDRGETLAFAELKGRCPAERFDQLLAALGWPQTLLAFEITQQGIVVDEATFRRQAEDTLAQRASLG